MEGDSFGEFLREQRLKTGYSLRTFAKVIDMQPSNLSFIESGKTNPPRSTEILFKIASALGLKKDSREWGELFDLASKEASVPADIAADKNIRDYLPIMLRTIAEARLTKQQLKELIETIKESRRSK